MNARTNRIVRIAIATAIVAGSVSQAHALLLPAIQKVRDAAARAEDRPVENIALNVEKAELLLAVEAGQLPPEALLEVYSGDPGEEINGGLNRDIIRRIPK